MRKNGAWIIWDKLLHDLNSSFSAFIGCHSAHILKVQSYRWGWKEGIERQPPQQVPDNRFDFKVCQWVFSLRLEYGEAGAWSWYQCILAYYGRMLLLFVFMCTCVCIFSLGSESFRSKLLPTEWMLYAQISSERHEQAEQSCRELAVAWRGRPHVLFTLICKDQQMSNRDAYPRILSLMCIWPNTRIYKDMIYKDIAPREAIESGEWLGWRCFPHSG